MNDIINNDRIIGSDESEDTSKSLGRGLLRHVIVTDRDSTMYTVKANNVDFKIRFLAEAENKRNNKDIVIDSDLHNLIMKNEYSFDSHKSRPNTKHYFKVEGSSATTNNDRII